MVGEASTANCTVSFERNLGFNIPGLECSCSLNLDSVSPVENWRVLPILGMLPLISEYRNPRQCILYFQVLPEGWASAIAVPVDRRLLWPQFAADKDSIQHHDPDVQLDQQAREGLEDLVLLDDLMVLEGPEDQPDL